MQGDVTLRDVAKRIRAFIMKAGRIRRAGDPQRIDHDQKDPLIAAHHSSSFPAKG